MFSTTYIGALSARSPLLQLLGGGQRCCGNEDVSVFGNGNKVNSPKIIINNGTIINGNGNKVGNNCIDNDRFCGGRNQNRMFGMMAKMMNFFMQMMQQMMQTCGCGCGCDQGGYGGSVLYNQYPGFQMMC